MSAPAGPNPSLPRPDLIIEFIDGSIDASGDGWVSDWFDSAGLSAVRVLVRGAGTSGWGGTVQEALGDVVNSAHVLYEHPLSFTATGGWEQATAEVTLTSRYFRLTVGGPADSAFLVAARTVPQ
jgi:hypothetical protein